VPLLCRYPLGYTSGMCTTGANGAVDGDSRDITFGMRMTFEWVSNGNTMFW